MYKMAAHFLKNSKKIYMCQRPTLWIDLVFYFGRIIFLSGNLMRTDTVDLLLPNTIAFSLNWRISTSASSF